VRAPTGELTVKTAATDTGRLDAPVEEIWTLPVYVPAGRRDGEIITNSVDGVESDAGARDTQDKLAAIDHLRAPPLLFVIWTVCALKSPTQNKGELERRRRNCQRRGRSRHDVDGVPTAGVGHLQLNEPLVYADHRSHLPRHSCDSTVGQTLRRALKSSCAAEVALPGGRSRSSVALYFSLSAIG
jgi:hypothetical protein